MFGLDPGFLPQLAQGGVVQRLAVVDPALRHLPEIAFSIVDPLTDERMAVAVDKHHANAGAVGQVVKILGHVMPLEKISIRRTLKPLLFRGGVGVGFLLARNAAWKERPHSAATRQQSCQVSLPLP